MPTKTKNPGYYWVKGYWRGDTWVNAHWGRKLKRIRR